jgi:hypothetical protein
MCLSEFPKKSGALYVSADESWFEEGSGGGLGCECVRVELDSFVYTTVL